MRSFFSPRVLHPGSHPVVLRVPRPALPPRVLRDQFPLDEFVELVQVNIAEDRGDYSALRHAAKRVAVNPVFHVPGLEHVADKPQEPLIVDFLCQYSEKDFVAETAEAVRDVSLDKPHGPGPGFLNLPECDVTPAPFPEPVRHARKARLADRLQKKADHLTDQLV